MNRRSFIRFFIIASLAATATVSCSLFQNKNNQVGQNNPPIQKIDVGAVLPLTGSLAYLGEGEKFGMELALREYKEKNPNAKAQINFIFGDSQGKPDIAVSVVRKLLDIQNINIQVVSTTGVSKATLPLYKESGKDVLVFAQATAPELTKDYPFAYRIYITADQEARILAKYAQRQKYLKIGALYVRNKAGEDSVKYLQKQIDLFGGTVVLSESFAINEKNIRDILEKFKKADINAIAVYGYATNYPIIAQQIEEAGLNLPILANSTFSTNGVENNVSSSFLKRVVFPAPKYYVSGDEPNVKSFNDKVKSQGQNPTIDIAFFYDMTNILLKALEISPSTKPSDIKQSILSIMPYQGVTGTIRLNGNRDSELDLDLIKFGDQGKEVIKMDGQN